jgi:site-specific DNA-cytosine methylase
MSAPSFINRFCGCSNFTLGMQHARFDCLAAIHFNAEAVVALRANRQAKNPTALPPMGFASKVDLTSIS